MLFIKNKDDAINYILKKYLKIQDNVLLSERLFIANSVLDWIYRSTNNQKVIDAYLNDLEEYLKGNLDLRWIDGVVIKKESRDKNDYKESEAKEKTGSTT